MLLEERYSDSEAGPGSPCQGAGVGGHCSSDVRVVDRGVPGVCTDAGIARAQPMGYTIVPGSNNSQNVPSFLIDTLFEEVS